MTTQPDRRNGEERRTYPNLGVVFEHRTLPDRRQVYWKACYDALLAVTMAFEKRVCHPTNCGFTRAMMGHSSDGKCDCGIVEARAKFAALESRKEVGNG